MLNPQALQGLSHHPPNARVDSLRRFVARKAEHFVLLRACEYYLILPAQCETQTIRSFRAGAPIQGRSPIGVESRSVPPIRVQVSRWQLKVRDDLWSEGADRRKSALTQRQHFEFPGE